MPHGTSEPEPQIACIALGTNLGSRNSIIEGAIRALDGIVHTRLIAASSVIETAPVGPSGQGNYLNAAATLATTLSPHELLRHLLAIEVSFGRVRRERWGPRTLDLDLILLGDAIVNEDDLTVPHPRFRDRLFVLEPLASIAPEILDPVTGRTIEALLHGLQQANPGVEPAHIA
jgi:2-amino-4-hydroxy-6-hydroxymethyldihydropteridine diphosphokinase